MRTEPAPPVDLLTWYVTPQSLSTRLAGVHLTYLSKPGIADWDSVSPEIHLLVENADLGKASRVLLLGGGNGLAALGLHSRFPGLEIGLYEINFVAQTLSEKNISLHQAQQQIRIVHRLDEIPAKSLEAAAIFLPKGIGLCRRWLLDLYALLQPGGELYLVGSNQGGVQSVIRDAEAVFQKATILAYKKGHRLARLIRPHTSLQSAPPWASESGIKPGTWAEARYTTRQGEFQMLSHPGVFSYQKLDPATKMVLDHWEIDAADILADLGCGFGALGITASYQAAQVDLFDSNILAVETSQKNLETLQQTNARALPGDVLSSAGSRRYTQIATNPPFHTGMARDHYLPRVFMAQSRRQLVPGGRLLLVSNRFLNYEVELRKLFPDVRVQAADSRYILFCARKSESAG